MIDAPRLFEPRYWVVATAISFLAWTILGLIFSTLQFFDLRRSGNPTGLLRLFGSNAPFWYSWALLTPAVLRFAQRHPVARQGLLRRLGLHALGCVTSIGTSMILVGALRVLLVSGADDEPLALLLQLLFFGAAPGVMIYCSVVGIGSGLEYARRLREHHLRALRLDSLLSRARLEALLRQLQPHFVFNTLHAIASLVRKEESSAAIDMIARLSELLRRTLRCDPHRSVPLSEELDLIEQYLDIERVRLGDRLQIELDLTPEALKARVPVLLLLPIVENAIRHGVAPVSRPCRLWLRASVEGERLQLVVENEGASPEQGASGEGVGLKNSRERLAAWYGDDFELTLEPRVGGGARLMLEIPASGWAEQEER